MATPDLYEKGLVGLSTGLIATLNVGGAGKVVLQNAANTTLCTIILNNPSFGTPNAVTGIASLIVSPPVIGVVGVLGTISKFLFQDNASANIFGGVAGSFVFTVDTVTDELNCASHPFVDTNTMYVESTGTLPAGLSPATLYHVVNSAVGASLKLSLTSGGIAIDITGVGTGSHRVYASNCSLKVPAVVLAGDTISISSFNFDPVA